MAKKKKRNTPKKRTPQSKQTAVEPKKRSKYPVLALIAGGVLALGGAYFLYQGEKPPNQSPVSELKAENISLRENRATLSPQRFTGTVRKAYEIAREIPQVLDRLYCYCRCRENFGHKNLLSCYVDTHAST